ncbi:unnamed protein product [Brassica oleracea]
MHLLITSVRLYERGSNSQPIDFGRPFSLGLYQEEKRESTHIISLDKITNLPRWPVYKIEILFIRPVRK